MVLAVATKHGLEGIVSKKTHQRYVSGKNPSWIKGNTATWREANRDRFVMFQNAVMAGIEQHPDGRGDFIAVRVPEPNRLPPVMTATAHVQALTSSGRMFGN